MHAFLKRLALLLALMLGAATPSYAQLAGAAGGGGSPTRSAVPISYVTIGCKTNFTRGNYNAYANCVANSNTPGDPPIGVDTITLNPDLFRSQAAVAVLSDWTGAGARCSGICGYVNIAYGCYDSSVVQTPITARQVNAITTLTSTFDITYDAAAAQYFGGLHEFYLWSNTTCTGQTKGTEVAMFTHTSTEARTYATGSGSALIGNWTDTLCGGEVWRVSKRTAISYIIAVTADGLDYSSGCFDFKGYLTYLQSQTDPATSLPYVAGTEWFKGIAIGIEPTQNVTSWRLNSWLMTYN